MTEEIFITLQHYFFDYCVDKNFISSISRVACEEDDLLTFDLIGKGDVLQISTVASKNMYIQSGIEESYKNGEQTKYKDIIEEKLFIKYYGKFAENKLRNIVTKKRHTGSDANLYLINNNLCLNYEKNIRNIKIKINENFVNCAIVEAKIRYKVVSLDDKNYNKIIDTENVIKN